jgi:hypothetical protein
MRVLISSVSSFWLSREAVLRARELDAAWAFPDHLSVLGEPECHIDEEDRPEGYMIPSGLPRHDPLLLRVFDEIGGRRMSGWDDATVECVEIPDDVVYYVDSYCAEWISEQHRQWGVHEGIMPGERLASEHVFDRHSRFDPKA